MVLAMEGRPTVANDVLPFTNVDLVSYSAYDTVLKATTDPPLARKNFRDALSHLALKMPDTETLDPNGHPFGNDNIFISEFGGPEQEWGVNGSTYLEQVTQVTVEEALDFGCQWVIYWEVFCNECCQPDDDPCVPVPGPNPKADPANSNDHCRGFWLRRVDGSYSSAWTYLAERIGSFIRPTTDFDAELLDSQTINLTWRDTLEEENYRIEHSINGDLYTLMAEPPQNSVSHLYNNCEPGNTYRYRLRSEKAGLEPTAWFYSDVISIPIYTTTSTISSSSTTITLTTTTSVAPPIECETNDDCEDDGLFCNGAEICSGGRCVSAGNPCPDDELFCNGEESCDEGSDECLSSGDPCSEPTPICDEDLDRCVGPGPACDISIEPETAEVVSMQTLSFTAQVTGEDCLDPEYVWSIETTIGSSIDQNGNYVAGINYDFSNEATDVVTVDDNTNGISIEATVTVSWGCSLLQIYGEGSEEVKVLRSFRDNMLSQTPEGRELIRLYYQWSPVIVKAMEKDEGFREEVKEMIDGVLEVVGGGVEQIF